MYEWMVGWTLHSKENCRMSYVVVGLGWADRKMDWWVGLDG